MPAVRVGRNDRRKTNRQKRVKLTIHHFVVYSKYAVFSRMVGEQYIKRDEVIRCDL